MATTPTPKSTAATAKAAAAAAAAKTTVSAQKKAAETIAESTKKVTDAATDNVTKVAQSAATSGNKVADATAANVTKVAEAATSAGNRVAESASANVAKVAETATATGNMIADATVKTAVDAVDQVIAQAEAATASLQAGLTANTDTLITAVSDSTNQVFELNSLYLKAAKNVGNQGLDFFEKNSAALFDAQLKFAEAVPVPGLSDVVKSQVNLAKSLTAATTSMTRELLK